MKKRLYQRSSKKRDIFILIMNAMMIYLLLSWDLFFGDVFALSPGYMLTMIYALEKKGHMGIFLSTVYAVLWTLLFPSFVYLSPIFFIAFSLLSVYYNRRQKFLQYGFFIFYLFQFVFCIGFFNQLEIHFSQFFQLVLFLFVFFHVKGYKKRN